MEKKRVKKVCKCEKCGNEAEMVITCTLEEAEPAPKRPNEAAAKKVKGSATCSHCGNEADMWVDLE